MPLSQRAAALLLAAGCSGGSDTGAPGDGWRGPSFDLGPARAAGKDARFPANDDAWRAAAQVIPGIDHRSPLTNIPLLLWDALLAPNVSEPGVCPAEEIIPDGTAWRSYGCRTRQGTELEGEASRTRTDDGTLRTERWSFDIAAVPDVEDRSFDTLSLEGELVYVDGDDTDLAWAATVNLRAHAEGYWARANPRDPRESLWNDWVVSARAEATPDGAVRVEGTATLGGLGGFAFHGDGLRVDTDDCTSVPEGVVVLEGAETLRLTFPGDGGCARCARLERDGAFAGQSCGL